MTKSIKNNIQTSTKIQLEYENTIKQIYDFINEKQLGNPEINKIHSMLEYAKLQTKMIVLPTDMEKIKDNTQYRKSKKQQYRFLFFLVLIPE